MTMYLSAIGWVDEAPLGNRLRWHYPVEDVLTSLQYVGLPKTVVVERAPLERQDLFRMRESTSLYPYAWWELHGDIPLSGVALPFEHLLAAPVQAVTFAYQGAPGRLVIHDRATNRKVLDGPVTDGDTVYAEAASLDSILVFASWGLLHDLRGRASAHNLLHFDAERAWVGMAPTQGKPGAIVVLPLGDR